MTNWSTEIGLKRQRREPKKLTDKNNTKRTEIKKKKKQMKG